jgi:UDP-N-acetylmuramoylalanine--D-glutamate ligase
VRFSELEGAAVGVWGAGREACSFAAQLRRRLPGATIAVVAFDTSPDPAVLEKLGAPQARVVVGPDAGAALASCEVVVRSPGVSIHRPEVRSLREAGTPVTTASALWLAEHGGAGVIGITGTKGKSTTAALTHHLARAAGADSVLAGNIGAPALDLLDRERPELVVLELSSYQIADLETGPDVAVFTSLFREHLDWHGSDQTYRDDKLRLIELPGVQTAVVNARFPELVEGTEAAAQRVLYGLPSGWDADESGVRRGGKTALTTADLPLPGEHNALNVCAALAALECIGVEPPLPEGLADFRPLRHRLEVIGEDDGLLWVDDSISTTPESTLAALAAFGDREVVLLAGGQDRGQDYGALGAALAERGTALVGMPTTGERIVTAARAAGVDAGRALGAEDLQAAVDKARDLAAPGAVLLLSPAAPSYDRYRNFEERGERFRQLR